MNYEELTPLVALERLKDRAIHDEYLFKQDTNREKAISFLNEIDTFVNVIKQTLEQAQEDKEMLDIFKNALTIKHDDANVIHNDCGGMIEMIYTIEKNKLNEQLRKSLREWVLENAFPKELKALEIIKDRLIVEDKGGYIQVVCEFSIPSKSKNYNLLKEVLL